MRPKGSPRTPGSGRKPGVPNKSTANAKEALARLVDANVERVQDWLDAIASTEGPKAALDCFLRMAEFHVPKLARQEVTGKDGEPLVPTVVVHEIVKDA